MSDKERAKQIIVETVRLSGGRLESMTRPTTTWRNSCQGQRPDPYQPGPSAQDERARKDAKGQRPGS